MSPARGVIAFLLVAALSGCSLFSTREPEAPITSSGTFSQPDTPEQVIENIENAVRELNTLNYRRSLSETLDFQPTASAEAREPVFASWDRAQEEQYFSALVSAAEMNTGHSLTLNDRSLTLVSPTEFVLDATYVLSVNHRRTEAPTEVQGRLQWTLVQQLDGLWSLETWIDQELGPVPTWSDLKAEFMK
ncbi:MAG: hypothetical protein RIE53_10240 [Rhodothermales bacterium]